MQPGERMDPDTKKFTHLLRALDPRDGGGTEASPIVVVIIRRLTVIDSMPSTFRLFVHILLSGCGHDNRGRRGTIYYICTSLDSLLIRNVSNQVIEYRTRKAKNGTTDGSLSKLSGKHKTLASAARLPKK